jgi:MFS family permease
MAASELSAAQTNSARAALEASVAKMSAGYRRYVLFLLLIVYILNFLDRQIINILAEPIKRDLGLMDWQLGMMTGLAFALFYTFLGLPIARFAEHANRVRIVSAALVLWSMFTAACGFAQNFIQLLLCRIGVGVGEAGCSPPSHSLISDYAPKEKRASALATYSMGIPLGSMAGMALGGLIADAFGWRAALWMAGLPGVAIAILMLMTVREPRNDAKVTQIAAPKPDLRAAIQELKSKKTLWWAAIGAGSTSFVTYGHTSFYGSFFYRNHAEGIAEVAARLSQMTGMEIGVQGFVGTGVGLIIGLSGVVGTWLGGLLTDRYGVKDARAYVLFPAVAAFFGVPSAFIALFVDHALAAMALLTIPILLKSFWYGPIYATAQSLVQPRTRATAAALILFVINLIGMGLGPLAVGTLSDVLASNMGEAQGLRWAMALGSTFGFISMFCFYKASRTIRDEIVS